MSDHEEQHAYDTRLAYVKQLLLQLYEPLEVDAWLNTPQRYLQERRPVDLLWNEMGYLEVCGILHRVLDGSFV